MTLGQPSERPHDYGFVGIGQGLFECDLCATPVRPCNMRRHREACEREFAIWDSIDQELGLASDGFVAQGGPIV